MSTSPGATEPARSAPPSIAFASASVATLRLNRPAHHNRLEPGDILVLRTLIDDLAGRSDIRAVILTATGRSFCAGYDLGDLGTPLAASSHAPVAEGASDDVSRQDGIAIFADVVNALETCRMPTICALNGPVFGGGTDLALACDFRIATPGCRMTMPAGRFGLHYYHGGLRRYVERLGLGAAKRLFLLGETLDAAAMLRIGYLDEVLEDDAALMARAQSMAASLAGAADPDVIDSMKACLNRIAAGDRDPTVADAAWSRTRRSPAVGAAVAAERARQRARPSERPDGERTS